MNFQIDEKLLNDARIKLDSAVNSMKKITLLAATALAITGIGVQPITAQAATQNGMQWISKDYDVNKEHTEPGNYRCHHTNNEIHNDFLIFKE